jgi:hypothetical protein
MSDVAALTILTVNTLILFGKIPDFRPAIKPALAMGTKAGRWHFPFGSKPTKRPHPPK